MEEDGTDIFMELATKRDEPVLRFNDLCWRDV